MKLNANGKRIAATVAVLIFAALALSACFDVEEHLVVRPDGSGSLSLKVRSNASLYEISAELGLGGGISEPRLHYPPTTMESLQVLFPGEQFVIEEVPNDDVSLAANIKFKDINELLNSPYAEVKSMTMEVEHGQLLIRTRTGLDGIAGCRKSEKLENHPYYGPMVKELCSNAAEAKFQFRVTLPAEAESQTGNTAGSEVTWKISKQEIAASGMDFTAVMSAACPAQDIGFAPRGENRIDLRPFTALASGKTRLKADKPSAADYRGVEFQPLELSITSSFTYTSSLHLTNLACLTGLITVPADLAPDQWGAVRLVKAVDTDGTDLLLSDKRRMELEARQSNDWFDGSRINSGDSDQIHHPVTLLFKPPAWTSNKIPILSAEAELVFFTSESIVKIENAVPEKSIRDQTQPNSAGSGTQEARRIINPALEDAGIELFVEDAVDMGMALMVLVKIGSPHAAIEDIGFFDRPGNPLSCILSQTRPEWGDDRQGFIAILPGRPEPPLSMACRFRYGGEPVVLPFDINNLNARKANTDS